MIMAAVAMFGLSRLAAASPNDTVIWFVLLGLGLAPVMVGATDVIVGNARGTGRRGRQAGEPCHVAGLGEDPPGDHGPDPVQVVKVVPDAVARAAI
jgi:hypothetical protein